VRIRRRPRFFVLPVNQNNGIVQHRQMIIGHQRLHPATPGQAPEMTDNRSRLLEIARVLVRHNHVARCIVNANHSVM
jgi:hypothetical protein